MVYTCLWLAFPWSVCLCNAGLHLNGFQPYKEILMYQASKQEDRFHCRSHMVGLAPTISKLYTITIIQYPYNESKHNEILIDKTDIEDADDNYGSLDDQAHHGYKYQPSRC